jgi:hypothetical protein
MGEHSFERYGKLSEKPTDYPERIIIDDECVIPIIREIRQLECHAYILPQPEGLSFNYT